MTGWRWGDPVAAREFACLGDLYLELGGDLDVRLAYQTYGTPGRDANGLIDNAVLVCHALTADAHVAGTAGPGQPTPGWWNGLVGPGQALDTDRWFVVSANVLGGCQGSTGPWSVQPFPRITIRDQVRAEARLADHLGISSYACVMGASMGGMRALEWLIHFPGRARAGLVLASCAAATADQIATQSIQIQAVRDDPVHGLGLARRIAQITYRTAEEFQERFGRAGQPGENPLHDGRYAVQGYLDHHADKLARRFDPDSYVILTDAMNTHDVGRGRGGVAAALGTIADPVVVGGIDSDRLYPLALQAELVRHIPTSRPLRVIKSVHGHDGFLVEHHAVGELITEALVLGEDRAASAGLGSVRR